jgi:hypothetical protein
VAFHGVFSLTKWNFYFQGICLSFFVRFSISLFNSSFIFCFVIFNSYISLFTVSFVTLLCLLKSSLSSLY